MDDFRHQVRLYSCVLAWHTIPFAWPAANSIYGKVLLHPTMVEICCSAAMPNLGNIQLMLVKLYIMTPQIELSCNTGKKPNSNLESIMFKHLVATFSCC